MEKKHVRILATGGTIAGRAARPGSVAEYESGVVAVDELLAAAPGLADAAEVSWRRVAAIGSEDMTDEIWLALLDALDECMAEAVVDGVVVLHGTDTLEESAYLAHLACRPDKPVVFTGALRPSDAPSADGPGNILNAVRLAASDGAAALGTVVLLADEAYAAREAVKMDMLSCNAFAAPNAGPVARLVDGRPRLWRPGPFRGAGEFAGEMTLPLPRVEVLYGHAGMRREPLDALLASGVEGIVYAGVGLGNIHAAVRPALAEAAAGGVAVVCSSRVPRGVVPAKARDRRERFIAAGDLNPQKARVLLRLALLRDPEPAAIQRLFDRC